ncbi:TPA: hypothetical protein ACUI23_002416 [Staphylococcus pseudintermedius]
MFVTRPFTGRIFDQRGHNAMMYPVIAIFAIGLVILSGAQGTWLIVLSAIFIGMGYGIIVPSGQAIMPILKTSPKAQIGYPPYTKCPIENFFLLCKRLKTVSSCISARQIFVVIVTIV